MMNDLDDNIHILHIVCRCERDGLTQDYFDATDFRKIRRDAVGDNSVACSPRGTYDCQKSSVG